MPARSIYYPTETWAITVFLETTSFTILQRVGNYFLFRVSYVVFRVSYVVFRVSYVVFRVSPSVFRDSTVLFRDYRVHYPVESGAITSYFEFFYVTFEFLRHLSSLSLPLSCRELGNHFLSRYSTFSNFLLFSG